MASLPRVAVSVLAFAGLVWEAFNARNSDPYLLSWQSILLTFLYATLLFVVNLKSFKHIELNIGRFDFDQYSLSGSMHPVKDRARAIVKILGIDVIPTPND